VHWGPRGRISFLANPWMIHHSPLDSVSPRSVPSCWFLVQGATVGIAFIDFWIGFAVGFVVAHFFLFCNLVRLSRSLELIWAGIFTALCILASVDLLTWRLTFTISGGLTVVVVVIEARRPSYHGVGWRILNPRLPEWWRSRTGAGAGGTMKERTQP
jgi:hypothetical protein